MNARPPSVLLLLLLLLGGACEELRPSPSPIPTTIPTATPIPTSTLPPTPTPTVTPSPGPSPRPTLRPTPTPLPRPPLAYGVSVHLFGQDRGRVLDLAREAGFGWIRQQVWWRHIEPAKGSYTWGELDAIVADAHSRRLKVLLSVVRSPDWATGGGYGLPRDPDDFGDFLFALASRYRGRVQAYEVWNEPNLALENAGRVADPGRYVELLRTAYRSIKKADPTAKVISAPLTPTGVTRPWLSTDDIDYLREMLAYGDGIFLSSCDAVGVHAAGTHNPPDTLWPERPGPGPGWLDHPTHYFRHVENIHGVLAEFGAADKPIWITEFGWATANYSPGYEYGYDNTEEEQASYIVRALEIVQEDWPWVEGVFLWNLNFAVVRGDWHEQGAFGILRSDWSPRPAYEAVRKYLHYVQSRDYQIEENP